jgi:hypothetical protein
MTRALLGSVALILAVGVLDLSACTHLAHRQYGL